MFIHCIVFFSFTRVLFLLFNPLLHCFALFYPVCPILLFWSSSPIPCPVLYPSVHFSIPLSSPVCAVQSSHQPSSALLACVVLFHVLPCPVFLYLTLSSGFSFKLC